MLGSTRKPGNAPHKKPLTHCRPRSLPYTPPLNLVAFAAIYSANAMGNMRGASNAKNQPFYSAGEATARDTLSAGVARLARPAAGMARSSERNNSRQRVRPLTIGK